MFAFSLRKLVDTVSTALDTYNKDLYSFVEAKAAPYFWAEGGEWPAYSQRFFRLFPNIQSTLAVTFDYVKCYALVDVERYITQCLDTRAICAMNVPYSLDYKLSVLKQLTTVYPNRKVTVVVQSSATVLHLQTILSNVHADSFLHNKSVADIEFISPAAILDQIASRSRQKYGVLVLDEANTVNIMYSLLRRVLPYISEFPVYLDACDVDSCQRTHLTSPTIESVEAVASATLLIGHEEELGVSPTMVGSIPVDGYDAVCDTGYRVLPVVEEGAYVTSYLRHATAYEKNKTVMWANANGYKRVNSVVNSRHTIKQQIGADSYTVLLWAIEIITGIGDGNVDVARRIWMSSGFSSAAILDPITLSLRNNISRDLPVHMSGVTENGAIWNIYQYSNLLYSNFVYEQRHLPDVGRELTLRIGYETRYGRPPIYRLMITQTPGEIFHTNDYIITKFLKYYYSIVGKTIVCGFDFLADYIPCDHTILSSLDIDDARWVLANRMLPSYRTIELVAVVSLWNKHMSGVCVGSRCTDMLKMFCDYFTNC